jgi:hypothetical protein
MNATITIKKSIYPKSQFRANGTGFNSTIEVEGYNYDDSIQTGLNRNGVLSEEIDLAVKRLIEVRVNQTPAVDVTVSLPNGYTLSVALQQHYADKFTIEPEINSITFA